MIEIAFSEHAYWVLLLLYVDSSIPRQSEILHSIVHAMRDF